MDEAGGIGGSVACSNASVHGRMKAEEAGDADDVRQKFVPRPRFGISCGA
jgi:hypothetical protein